MITKIKPNKPLFNLNSIDTCFVFSAINVKYLN